jgi:ribosomal protein L29
MADKKASKKAPAKAEKVAAKTPKKVDYLQMSEAELEKAIAALREDVVTLKRGTVMGEVQNVRAYNARRKELARALTARNTAREVK